MSQYPIVQPVSADPPAPLARRVKRSYVRLPIALAAMAAASLLLPPGKADAAELGLADNAPGIAAAAGVEPAAQQREGRRGGGEFRGQRGGGGREFRGGGNFGGGREFRGQNRNNIGTARIDTPREFRQERRADRQDFRQERRGDRQDLRREQRGDLRDFRQERRGDRQDLRNGVVTRPEFRADRRDDRQDFRRDQRGDLRDFRADRRDDRRDFRADRRGDRRDYRDNRQDWGRRDWDRRGYSNRGWNGRDWDRRGWDGRGRNWDRGWRNDRRYDWYGWRNQNRAFFNVGRYYPPVRGWNYRRIGIGFTLGAPFFASSFWINDPWSYRLPPAYGQYRWVRYYGDVLLVDIYTGQVVDVINDFFW
ncbi:RcnB family protein [Blastomonas sp.]|uniref:RcnB family protein n=1 Tax=Blastomonas sp. TaxID=1909299 RepID=UPI00406A213C